MLTKPPEKTIAAPCWPRDATEDGALLRLAAHDRILYAGRSERPEG
jgi:hypothetical protein